MRNLKEKIALFVADVIDEEELLAAIAKNIPDYIDYDDIAETVLEWVDINEMARDAVLELL